MIGLDTNVVIRYLTQDDPVQSRKAVDIIEALTELDPGFISVVTTAETVWVLERAYNLKNSELAATVESLLQADVFLLENEQQVFSAMAALKAGVASFADALISELGTNAGCSYTLTFDKKGAKLRGFRLL